MEKWKICLVMNIEQLFNRSFCTQSKVESISRKEDMYIKLDMQKNADTSGSMLEVNVIYGNIDDNHFEFIAKFRIDHYNKAQIASFLCEILENF